MASREGHCGGNVGMREDEAAVRETGKPGTKAEPC